LILLINRDVLTLGFDPARHGGGVHKQAEQYNDAIR
jgi:hypothetical protein